MRSPCHVKSCVTCFYMVCLHPCSASVPSCFLHGPLREKLVTYPSPFRVSGGRGHAIAPAVRLLHSILDLGARASIVLVQHHHFRNQGRLRIKPNCWGMLEVPHERPFRLKTDAHSGTFLPIRAHSDIFATWKCRKTHAAGAHSLQPISPYIILNRGEQQEVPA